MSDEQRGPETARRGLTLPAVAGAPSERSGEWDVPDGDGERGPATAGDPARPMPVLVSLQYLRAALRRRRRLLLAGGVLGLLAGLAFPALAPAGRTATATLYLSHDPSIDPARAMSTDVSLLATRAVAQRTIDALTLEAAPEDVLGSVTSVPTTSDLLVLTMKGPTSAEAVRRLDAFTRAYLDFRGTQVSAQSDALIRGDRERIAMLQSQLGELTRRISSLAGRADDSGQLNDAISQRAQLSAQIGSLEQAMQDEMLRRSAIVSASRVIDPATAKTGGGMRTRVLSLASGLVGGAAVAFAAVVVTAITSDRIRLRVEVAAALEAPVRASTGPLAPPRGLRRLTGTRAWRRRGLADLGRAAHVVQRELTADGSDRRLVVAAVDNSREVCLVVAAAALAVRERFETLHLVDLTVAGGLEAALARLARDAGTDPPPVLRPGAVPSIGTAPPPLSGPWALPGLDPDDGPPVPGPRDAVLVAADLDEGVDADHLGDWCHRVVVAVTAGRSGVERVRAARDVIRAAGLHLAGAVLVGTEPGDHSSGVYPVPGREPAPRASASAERAAG